MLPDLELLNGAAFRSGTDDDILFSVISDPGAFRSADSSWNRLVDECSSNPLLLSSYVEDRMELYGKKGWSPLLLNISKGGEIIGSVPLRVQKLFGIRLAKLLLEPHFSPDFVFRDEYREVCTEEALKFLFNTLNLNYLDFTLQVESQNLSILKKVCESKNIHFHESLGNAHRMIRIRCTWDEYVRPRRKKFREFRTLENKLNRAGSWRIVSFKNGEITSDVFKRVLDIEKFSWKEKWRIKRGLGSDEHHRMVWNASNLTKVSSLAYDWIIYFLELDGRAISFVIVLRYNGCSVMLKTSFDDRYRNFSPGKFVINAAIRDQFEDEGVGTIEMMTDLEVMGKWESLRLPRARVIMSNSRFLPRFVYHFSKPTSIKGFSISEFVRSLFNGQALRRMAIELREG